MADSETTTVYLDEDELWPHIALTTKKEYFEAGPAELDVGLYARYSKALHDFHKIRKELMEALEYD